MKFAESHEWIHLEEDVGAVGISSFAKNELGEIVFIEFPKVGTQVKKGQEICVLESTKAAADMYSPVSGTIVAINDKIKQEVESINALLEKDGWLFKIQLSDLEEYHNLLSLEEYSNLIC